MLLRVEVGLSDETGTVGEDSGNSEEVGGGREEKMLVPIVLVKRKDVDDANLVEVVGVTMGRVGVADGVMEVVFLMELLKLDEVMTGVEEGAVVELPIELLELDEVMTGWEEGAVVELPMELLELVEVMTGVEEGAVVELPMELLELDEVMAGVEEGAVVDRRLELRPGMELCHDCLPVVVREKDDLVVVGVALVLEREEEDLEEVREEVCVGKSEDASVVLDEVSVVVDTRGDDETSEPVELGVDVGTEVDSLGEDVKDGESVVDDGTGLIGVEDGTPLVELCVG